METQKVSVCTSMVLNTYCSSQAFMFQNVFSNSFKKLLERCQLFRAENVVFILILQESKKNQACLALPEWVSLTSIYPRFEKRSCS